MTNGYNVYDAPKGFSERYIGIAVSVEEARKLAKRFEDGSISSLEESLFYTAKIAGHCGGLSAPDKSGEDDEPAEYTGKNGNIAIVTVRKI